MEKPVWIGSLSGNNLKSKIQNLKWVGIVAISVTFVMCGAVAQAQQPKKVYRIGFLGNSTAALEANLVGPFRDGLRDLGYVEGRNILIEYRWAEGKYERFPALIDIRSGCFVPRRSRGHATRHGTARRDWPQGRL